MVHSTGPGADECNISRSCRPGAGGRRGRPLGLMAYFLACAHDPGVDTKAPQTATKKHTYMHAYMHRTEQHMQADHKKVAREATKVDRSAARLDWKRNFGETHAVWLRAECKRRDSESDSEPDLV